MEKESVFCGLLAESLNIIHVKLKLTYGLTSNNFNIMYHKG